MLTVGTRVEIINPKSVAHLAQGGLATTGKIVRIDDEYFARSNFRRNAQETYPWIKADWASDFPVSMRTTHDDRGFYVLRDDQTDERHATAYRAAELRFVAPPEETKDDAELR
jgi:hypothetical protein